MSLNKLDRNELLLTVFDACRCGYFDFVKQVFDEYPSEINLKNEKGQNCLMLAVEFNEIDLFKYLISKKHIDYLLSDYDDNWNCLHYALRYGNFRIAQMLLTKTSSVSIPNIANVAYPKYLNDSNGYNPFDLLPPNLYKKELYDDIYNRSNRNIQRKIYNSSFSRILQKGYCQRVYGVGDNKIVSNLQVQGVLYAWGNNINDQLGLNNHNKHRATPKIVKHLRNISITDISCSGYHSIAISEHGHVYVWGNNIDGRCGVGHCSNEFKPYIKRPTMLHIKIKTNNTKSNDNSLVFKSCTATLDHSTLLTNNGDVYAFGCDRNDKNEKNNKIVKYTKGSMKLIWNKRLEPFCITNNNKCDMRYINSSFERTVMIGTDNKLYIIGKAFNGAKLNKPNMIKSSTRDIKKIGIQCACVGDNWLVILLMNGTLLSMNKNKDNSEHLNFSEIRLNKEFRFRHHHNKREAITILLYKSLGIFSSTECNF